MKARLPDHNTATTLVLDPSASPDRRCLVSLVKLCGDLREVDHCHALHVEFARKGLLEHDAFAGNALVDMYCKCGLLTNAQEAFDSLPVRDVVSWTALIGGFAANGYGMEALACFQRMQAQAVCPNRITYLCVLKACGCIGCVAEGRKLNDELERSGFVKDLAIGNALIDMYSNCGALADTRRVFEQLPRRDQISWSALIMGYSKAKDGVGALLFFRQMQVEGEIPDSITFICILKACGSIKDTSMAKEVHVALLNRNLLAMDLFVANVLIDVYADCGLIMQAREVFRNILTRDIVSWNTLMDGCVKEGHGEEALRWAERMLLEGVFPDIFTFVACLKACGLLRATHRGKEFHAKAGSWAAQAVLGNALLDMYTKCGLMSDMQDVFDRIKGRDVVSWTSLIAGYANTPNADKALKCFQMMQAEGVSPNATTFVFVLKACGNLGAIDKSIDVHSDLARRGVFAKDGAVGNALVDMYSNSGMIGRAQEVFDSLHARDIVSWNTLMAGYVKHERGKEVVDCYVRMKVEGVSLNSISFICILKACGCTGAIPEGIDLHSEIARRALLSRDGAVGNTLVNMYIKCGLLARAKEAFYELPVRDVVSWTALIAGYTHHEQLEEALDCIDRMEAQGISPDGAMFVCCLKACGGAGAASKGRRLHADIARRGLLREDRLVGSAVIEMYASCGLLSEALEVSHDLPVHDTASRTALIEGYVQQGEIDSALQTFEKMKEEGNKLDAVSFVCVLNTCAHGGLVDEGQKYFQDMSRVHGIHPGIEHYSCMVDLVCRAGLLHRAITIVNQMPFEPDPVVWDILLDACEKWGNVEAGRSAFEQTVCLDEKDAAVYMRMCNICAGAGMQQEDEREEHACRKVMVGDGDNTVLAAY